MRSFERDADFGVLIEDPFVKLECRGIYMPVRAENRVGGGGCWGNSGRALHSPTTLTAC